MTLLAAVRAGAGLRVLVPLAFFTSGLALEPIRAQARRGPAEPGRAQEEAQSLPLTQGQTRGMVVRYKDSPHWAIKGIVLLSMGHDWHPIGAEIVMDALTHKDDRLKAFGVEVLRRTDIEALHRVLTAELVQELIDDHIDDRNDFYAGRAMDVLTRAFPDAEATKKRHWQAWWRLNKENYTLNPWHEVDAESSGAVGSAAASFVDRAFDLNQAGLEVAICIDSTGSMQPTIDAARRGLHDIVDVLEGISPEFKLGLVHYKDYEDFGNGAQTLVELTGKIEKVQKRLDRLVASGGGDYPERVEEGLARCYDEDMGWDRDANKVVIVLGDAPPHATAFPLAKEMAAEALARPLGVAALEPGQAPPKKKRGRTSAKSPPRPFVTSCIAVGAEQIQADTQRTFQEIAAAGGGSYGSILTNKGGESSRDIVRHILTLSFGYQYREQLDAFVDVFLEYKDAEYFD